MKFIAFPSIESFHNVVKMVKAYPEIAPGPVIYRGKIKLHGTNAGIRINEGQVVAQSRSQLIDAKNDNAGFARWVDSNKSYWENVGENSAYKNITIFGEWCGPGIMKGTAINQIPDKIFAVFAILVGESEEFASFIIQPDTISRVLANRPQDVLVLPWQSEPFTVDYSKISTLQSVVDTLNAAVNEIEPCDPWVKDKFGVEGTAEGIVYYICSNDSPNYKIFENFTFKAKGEKHKVVATKQAVQIDPEVAKNVDEFVNLFVTEARLEQGATAVGGSYEMKNVGLFLKWMSADIIKESVDELEASSLTWAQAEKAVQNKARKWFIEKSKVVAV